MKKSSTNDLSTFDPNPNDLPEYHLSIKVNRASFLDAKTPIGDALKKIYDPFPDTLREHIETEISRYPTDFVTVYVGSKSKCSIAEKEIRTITGVDTLVESIKI